MIYFNSKKKSPLLALLNSKRFEISPKNGWKARVRLPDGQVAGEPMTSFPNWRRRWDSISSSEIPGFAVALRATSLNLSHPTAKQSTALLPLLVHFVHSEEVGLEPTDDFLDRRSLANCWLTVRRTPPSI